MSSDLTRRFFERNTPEVIDARRNRKFAEEQALQGTFDQNAALRREIEGTFSQKESGADRRLGRTIQGNLDVQGLSNRGAFDRTQMTEEGAMARTMLNERGAADRANILETGAMARAQLNDRGNTYRARLGDTTMRRGQDLGFTTYNLNRMEEARQADMANRLGREGLELQGYQYPTMTTYDKNGQPTGEVIVSARKGIFGEPYNPEGRAPLSVEQAVRKVAPEAVKAARNDWNDRYGGPANPEGRAGLNPRGGIGGDPLGSSVIDNVNRNGQLQTTFTAPHSATGGFDSGQKRLEHEATIQAISREGRIPFRPDPHEMRTGDRSGSFVRKPMPAQGWDAVRERVAASPAARSEPLQPWMSPGGVSTATPGWEARALLMNTEGPGVKPAIQESPEQRRRALLEPSGRARRAPIYPSR